THSNIDVHAHPQIRHWYIARLLHLEVARRLDDLRVDLDDPSRRQHDAPHTLHAHRRTDAELAHVLLRHAEIHVHRIHGLERHHRITAGEVLADVDPADAERSAEWRPNLLAFDHGADLGHARLRLLQLRGQPIELRLRNHLFVEQPSRTVLV